MNFPNEMRPWPAPCRSSPRRKRQALALCLHRRPPPPSGPKEPPEPWLTVWAHEWQALAQRGGEEAIEQPKVIRNGKALVHARLAELMAVNSLTQAGPVVAAYLRHADLRWRFRVGGTLTALEVAEAYNLTDRRQNATKHLGDSLMDFAARTEGVPRWSRSARTRACARLPVALVKAWHRHGGGAS